MYLHQELCVIVPQGSDAGYVYVMSDAFAFYIKACGLCLSVISVDCKKMEVQQTDFVWKTDWCRALNA